MSLLRRLIREPLLHFLVAGVVVFAAWAQWGNTPADAHRIRVDRESLLRFMQYQSKAFEPRAFAARLDAMDEAQRRQLIADYVREESLYREARALGLERGDYVIRQRLVQKMSFLLESQANVEPTEAQLQQYLAQHAALYRVAAAWTFAHVFVDPVGKAEGAQLRARALLAQLNRERAAFNDAPGYSDRYPFLQNYVERTGEYIASHFGSEFAARLEQLPFDASRWQGPLQSDQGWHLVLVSSRAPQREPDIAEIRDQLRDDFRRDAAAALQEQAVREVVARYSVEVELGTGQ